MRPLRTAQRRAVALAALLAAVPVSLAVPSVVRAATAPEEPARPAPPEPFGAECRTSVLGSHVIAYCHNPYPDTDRVRLHTQCVRWWDIAADAAPVAVAPAQTVRLTDRCWKEVRAVWVTHEKPGPKQTGTPTPRPRPAAVVAEEPELAENGAPESLVQD